MPKYHHIFCNSQRGPADACSYCNPHGDGTGGPWAKYPYDPSTAKVEDIDNLVAKHFPGAVAIPGTGSAPGTLINEI